MTDRPRGHRPPFSPVLLAGLALRPLPPALLGPALDAAMALMRRRHGEVFARLAPLGPLAFLLDPTDLPFAFLLRPNGPPPCLRAVRDGRAMEPPAAVIRGPFLVLLDLLEGRLDGDAAFFSRALAIEGDTEAVLTLRNALESAEIRLVDDLAAALGPLGGPARQALTAAGTVFGAFARDLETLREALLAPVAARCDRQAVELRALEARLARLPPASRRSRLPGGADALP